jgi:hypothetical protein
MDLDVAFHERLVEGKLKIAAYILDRTGIFSF